VNLEIILHAGLATGTVLLFASIGELLAERSGMLNLGVEGMMLIGAMTGFSMALATGNPWLGLLAGDAGRRRPQPGARRRHHQLPGGSGGQRPGAHLSGHGAGARAGQRADRPERPLDPQLRHCRLASIPFIGPVFFEDHSPLVYLGYIFAPLVWFYIEKTRPGMHLRAVGEKPVAADTMGVSVYGLRYFYVFVGGCLAGLAGATISLSVSPGWYSAQTTSGQGWIAIGLVIFAQWNPLRAALGAYLFGALRRAILDLQGPRMILGFTNPLYINSQLGLLLADGALSAHDLALVIGSRAAMRKRHRRAGGALGEPYIRGERGL
jgi:ABC-type uncharacterized transport system permease subunit